MFWTCTRSARCQHAANILKKIPQRQIWVTKGEHMKFSIFLKKHNISASTLLTSWGGTVLTSAIVPWIFYWPTSGELNLFSALNTYLQSLHYLLGTALLIAVVFPLDHSWNYPSHKPKFSFKSRRKFPPSQWSFNQSLLWSTITCSASLSRPWAGSPWEMRMPLPPPGAFTTRALHFNYGGGL